MNIEELKKQYAEDAANCDRPWALWEYAAKGYSDWETCMCNPSFKDFNEYRRKPDAQAWPKQWSPEGKRLKNGDEFEFLKYIPGQDYYPIIGIYRNRETSYWLPCSYKESNFEEIPAPYSHIKIDDPVYVSDKGDYRKAHFAGINVQGDPCTYDDGCTSWTYEDLYKGITSWKHCLTVEEYNARFGEGK